jgi:hypothetical protein
LPGGADAALETVVVPFVASVSVVPLIVPLPGLTFVLRIPSLGSLFVSHFDVEPDVVILPPGLSTVPGTIEIVVTFGFAEVVTSLVRGRRVIV